MVLGFGQCILWAIVLISAPVFSKPTELERHIQEGQKYFKEFQNEKALEHFLKAADLDPANFDIRLMCLRINNSLGQDLRDRDRDSTQAEIYLKRNVGMAEKLYHDFPDRAAASFSLAIAYGNLAIYSSPEEKVHLSQNIEKNLKRSIQLDPNYPYGYLGLGIFYREVSNLSFIERVIAKIFFGEIPKATQEDSERNFRLSLARDPLFVFTHYHFALALRQGGKTEEAIKEYEEVIRLPATDSGDAYLKEVSLKALQDLGVDSPSISATRNTTKN